MMQRFYRGLMQRFYRGRESARRRNLPLRVEALEERLVLTWSSVMNWPITAIATNVLPTGRVLLWDETASVRRIWDPTTDTMTVPSPPGWNTFCAGSSFLADGRIFVTGGHNSSHVGYPYAGIYNPFDDTWTQVPDMNAGRWYATSTTLPNGDHW